MIYFFGSFCTAVVWSVLFYMWGLNVYVGTVVGVVAFYVLERIAEDA